MSKGIHPMPTGVRRSLEARDLYDFEKAEGVRLWLDAEGRICCTQRGNPPGGAIQVYEDQSPELKEEVGQRMKEAEIAQARDPYGRNAKRREEARAWSLKRWGRAKPKKSGGLHWLTRLIFGDERIPTKKPFDCP